MSDKKTVHEAWADVMEEVTALGKNQKHDSPGAKFMFRGIDALMNLVGPVLRKHRVSIVPTVTHANYRDVMTSGGKPSRESTLQVQFTVYGPAGDSFSGSTPGEAMDGGDKGTAKAMSVAYRIFLLQSLTLPTDEPDPDSEAFQRSSGPTPEQMAQRVADGLPTAKEAERVNAVKAWSEEKNLMSIPVSDEDGNSLPLGKYLARRLEELDPQAGADKQAQVDKALGSNGS